MQCQHLVQLQGAAVCQELGEEKRTTLYSWGSQAPSGELPSRRMVAAWM